MNKRREEKGITLVALIVTIIILVILAAVTIVTLVNQGIIDMAMKAGENYTDSQHREKEEIDKIFEMLKKGIVIEDLPENTVGTEVGTVVKLPDKWKNKVQWYLLTEKRSRRSKNKYKCDSVCSKCWKWRYNPSTIWILLCGREFIKWSDNIR